jgi:hypothetical protein
VLPPHFKTIRDLEADERSIDAWFLHFAMMPAGLGARTHFLTRRFEKAFVRARYLDKVQEERAKAGERFKGTSARAGAEGGARDHTLGSHKVCGVFYENTAAKLRDKFVSGKAAFQKMDRDGSGFLSFKELLMSLERVEVCFNLHVHLYLYGGD